ncbi:endo-beta-N-acetylglucosaminidase [Mycoplasma marinum]|uniref:Cytosolic endo-beta-N-acetylglucosaminidase TIM barrel domain-containing protein n=1 Tax=Mycoplasma marinum TaxID=1937190 RepID=A0A4R0XLI5_9MOLU|nr:hypothetical protein [Mycoplasma marinum]TCG11546.1 hypothetical protein C4B24_01715 [Mycoplasma marinum]
MKKKKLHIISVSTLAAISIVAPIALVTSCGTKAKDGDSNDGLKKDKNKVEEKKTSSAVAKEENGVFSLPTMSTPDSVDYGTKNYFSKDATLSNSLNKNEYEGRKATGDVYAPHLHPRDIAKWDAKNSVDGEYVRSRIPLQKRVVSPETNGIATKKDGRVYFMDTMRTNTSNSIVGTSEKNSTRQQILGAMQYATDWISFGGSTGEGTIYIPRAQDIDQLHRSGVKVHGTIFMAPAAYGGSPKAYAELLSAGPKATAKKLVEIANYYGFDGWMFNDENNIEQKDLPGWKEMLLELHKLSKPKNIEISYYTNQNRLSGQEIAKLGTDAVDVWFNDYNFKGDKWGTLTGSKKPADSSKYLDSAHSPQGVQATDGLAKDISGQKGGSIWFYTAVKDGQAFNNEQSKMTFINGASVKDTRDATTEGLAHWYKEYTTLIERKEFATSFNRGEGSNFNVNGKRIDSKSMKDGYSNFAFSDLQPTWRYIQDKVVGTTITKDSSLIIKQEEDSQDAWFGSSVLSYKGTVAAKSINTNKLYASKIPIKTKDKVEIMFKGNVAPKFVGWSNNGATKEIIDGKLSKEIFANGYKKAIFDLGALNNKVMTSFGVAFGTGVVNTKIGQLRYIPAGATNSTKTTVDKVIGEGQWFTPNGKNVRINIKTKDPNKLYMIYTVKDKKKELVEITNTPGLVIKGLGFNQELFDIEIVPYNKVLKPMDPIKIKLSTSTLKLEDDSKWTHRVVKKVGQFGVETMHGIVTSVRDGEGGAFLFDDQVSVIHYKKSGELDRSGNFGKKIFLGKNGWNDGDALATTFVSKSKKLFVSRKAEVSSRTNVKKGKNELYVYDNNLNPIDAFKLLKTDNALFGNDNEYVNKIFESKGYIYLISNKGNIKRVSDLGVLDTSYSSSVAIPTSTADVQVTILQNKDDSFELISQTNDRNFFDVSHPSTLATKVFSFGANGAITTNDTLGIALGTNATAILKTKDLGEKIVFVDREGRVFDYNKITKNIALRTTLTYGTFAFKKPFDFFPPSKIDLKSTRFSIVFSNDGNTIFIRDNSRKNPMGAGPQPWAKGFVEEFSRLVIFDISSNALDHLGRSYYIDKSTTTTLDGDYKKWGGSIRTMITLADNKILYGTEDFGRIGLINYAKNAKNKKLKLQEVGEVIFIFEKGGKKLPIKKAITLTGQDKNIKNNPTK